MRLVPLVIVLAWSAAVSAQTRDARLLVTVVDQTGGVLPGATVTLLGIEDATKGTGLTPVAATTQGVATFDGLLPGRYALKAEFDGFEPRINPDVRVRSGENRQTIALALKRLADEITVARDKQEAAVDRTTTFGSALTREQIDALSDDPVVLRQQLQDMAGGPAIIRVDSFEGAPLPPKAQIKSIHITRDAFAAENHNAGAFFVDIVTQPGIGPLRGQINYNLQPGLFTGNTPFTPVKGDELWQAGTFAIGGTLAPEKSSFSFVLQDMDSYTSPNLNVVTPSGPLAQALKVRVPRNNMNVAANLDYALTKDQTLRVSFNDNRIGTNNLGVGAYDLPERAYDTTNNTANLRLQHSGPVRRRMFINTRVNLTRIHSDQTSTLEAPTIQVLDAFTSGGAQMAGERTASWFTLASDLDYVRGRHSLRAGVLLNGGAWTSTLDSNYLGTYTFNSLAAYQAGQPSNFTRRAGNPDISYGTFDAGVYVQDDFRVRRNLTLSPGVRYEAQAHVNDWRDLGPRMGVTWAPFKSGRTALRASAGIFSDFFAQNTLEQVLRVDGTHEQEINIVNPSYPTPAVSGILPPANRYFFDPALELARNARVSVGIDQTLHASRDFTVRANALYAYTRTEHAWRGVNDNALAGGMRPDPRFANVVDIVSDASARQHVLTLGWNIGLPPQPPGNEIPKFFVWKRFAFYGQETITSAHNNTDGDFQLSPSGTLVDQWGRSILDVPSRLTFNFASLQFRRTTIQASLSQQSGVPFTITTGSDTNGDGIFNDRPAGVERNSLRGADQWNLFLYAQYQIPLRRRTTAVTGLIATQFSGTTPSSVSTFSDNVRYRLSFSVSAQNLTNHASYTGYSGVLTSPFFNQPTAIVAPRRITVTTSLNF
jgi:hypothetical protein